MVLCPFYCGYRFYIKIYIDLKLQISIFSRWSIDVFVILLWFTRNIWLNS